MTSLKKHVTVHWDLLWVIMDARHQLATQKQLVQGLYKFDPDTASGSMDSCDRIWR